MLHLYTLFADSTPFITTPTSSTVAAMVAPASESAPILSDAVAALPVMIAPAWPIRLPGGRRAARHQRNQRLGETALLDELRRFLLSVTANLPYQHHRFRLRVFLEHGQHVDKAGAYQGVAANTYAGGLPDARLGQGVDRFVGERSRCGRLRLRCPACVSQRA